MASSTKLPRMKDLRGLFEECDRDKNGGLTRDEFKKLCLKIGLDEAAASHTFERLDVDKDDRITFEEFAAGFNQYKRSASEKAPQNKASNETKQPAASHPLASNHRSNTDDGGLLNSRSPHRLSPSGALFAGRTRKTASPIGQLPTEDSHSPLSPLTPNNSSASWNTAAAGNENGSLTFFAGVDGSGSELSSADYSNIQANNHSAQHDSMLVYSSEMLADTGQCSNSGMFGSLSNSTSSLGQMKSMQDLLDCVQKLQNENQVLAQVLVRDRKERDEYINQLGEEFDMQVRQVEERYNRRTKDEVDIERRKYKEMIQTELEKLQNHYKTFEKMSKLVKSKTNKLDKEIDGKVVREKLEDTFQENRKLERSLLDTKSEVASIKDEMERLKRQYEDKLHSAYARNDETRSKCDDIKQQLNLMKDSNRKLQDASDAITNYITDTVDPVIKSTLDEDGYINQAHSGSFNSEHASSRRGSILSDYLSPPQHSNNQRPPSATNSLADGQLLLASTKQTEVSQEMQKSLSCQALGAAAGSAADKLGKRRVPKTLADERKKKTSNKSQESVDDQLEQRTLLSLQASSTESKPPLSKTSSSASSSIRNLGRHFFIGSRQQSDAQLAKLEPKSTTKERSTVVETDSEPLVGDADGDIACRFSIMLVGDSFVGKSSFAARFMGGEFVKGLISNCSIDFNTKNYKVDGVNYGIDLWDTAGQERFRSITASYFRKADGIILMYDVTEKRSYLNVRNWMSTISDAAPENVAVLLVGNKIDLRKEANKAKCVPREEGVRLAKEYGILFLETSVKTGANWTSSIGKLIRLIARNKEPIEEDKDRIKLSDKSRSFACMPKNC